MFGKDPLPTVLKCIRFEPLLRFFSNYFCICGGDGGVFEFDGLIVIVYDVCIFKRCKIITE